MTTRRKLFQTFGAGMLCAVLPALAQQPAHLRRIGYLSLATAQTNIPWLAAFRAGMAELRWIEGRDYSLDARYANNVAQAGPGLAAELLATQPDLLLAPGDEAIRTLAQATKTVPIVFAFSSDPVGFGLAASLQRPDGNLTGLTNLARELGGKRLQLLKEAFPRIAHVVVLINPSDTGTAIRAKEVADVAPSLGVRATPIEIRQAADIEPAFKRGAALGAHAYMIDAGFLVSSQRQVFADQAFRTRVPAMFSDSQAVEAGGLMSYSSPSFPDLFRRAATYADKILKGAKPGELPIEQPTKFQLVVNMKTAKAMGVFIPQAILLRADRVME